MVLLPLLFPFMLLYVVAAFVVVLLLVVAAVVAVFAVVDIDTAHDKTSCIC